MAGTLIIGVTKNDARIGERVFGVVNGLDNTALKLLWKTDDFGSFDGGGKYPLTLVGHANVSNFVAEYGGGTSYSSYISGDHVANELLAKNLRAKTFPFCLIAGCHAAASASRSGLFINVGDILQIPVIASTTPVALGGKGEFLQMTPQDGGLWKVYYPEEMSVFELNAERCAETKAALVSYVFRV